MHCIVNSPIGLLQIGVDDNSVTQIAFATNNKSAAAKKDSFMAEVESQLQQYFEKPGYKFTLTVKMIGTDFQQRVWRELRKIPYGKALTYGDLAQKLQTSPRAVGNACRANPLLLVVPCHRVVGKNSLGGFSGHRGGKWLQVKKQLLQHEGYLS